MESNAFSSLAVIQLPVPSRLLPSACCPDKDLVLLVTRLGGRDRMSLWKLSGSKTWEVDLSTSSEQIVGFAWSPDGQSIAVAHNPPSLTLHSLQDGHEERVVHLGASDGSSSRVTGVWWFSQEKPVTKTSVPDIFRRNNIIVSSSHSILRTLPLLDPLQDDSQQLTATDLFAFQGSQTTSRRAPSIPDVIKWWPTLQSDSIAASIDVKESNRTVENGLDSADDMNVDSILAVADDAGRLSCFLDGTYPLGSLDLGRSSATVSSLFKDQKQPIFLAHLTTCIDGSMMTDLQPIEIRFPLLMQRKVRDFAKMSTTARELCWYITRVVEEMRSVWFGSDAATGARELGPRWIRTLEKKQREQFGQRNPSSMRDLTMLLTTGRASEALMDFFGSGEQMSERGLQKWDSTVSEALVKLRDDSERRLAPACQRLHILLGEVKGWSYLPSLYPAFEISSESVGQCLKLVDQAIILAGWLAATARREHNCFKEFVSWLRYETTMANPANENAPPIRHDILQVNQYFMSGLESSTIDNWFTGPVPSFSPQDLGVPAHDISLSRVLQKARETLADPAQMQSIIEPKNLDFIDRNLSALVGELVATCRQVFDHPTGAATRSALVSFGLGSGAGQTITTRPASSSSVIIRERTTADNSGDGYHLQYLAIHAASTSEHRPILCFVRQRHGDKKSQAIHVDVALVECCTVEEGNTIELDLLAVEFFDDESVVIVYRTRNQEGGAFIATVPYHDLGYRGLELGGYVTPPGREDLLEKALERYRAGELETAPLDITRFRALRGNKSGGVTLGVNGRVGRRIACVVDWKGTGVETLDLEGEEERTMSSRNSVDSSAEGEM